MADFRSPFVPDLPRFTGGAVGYLGYGAASWFEPVLGDLGEGADGADHAGLHAVRHRAGVRSRAAPHPDHRQRANHGGRRPRVAVSVRVREDPVPRARARAQSLARRAHEPDRRSRDAVEPHARAVRGAGARGQGVHRRRRHLSGRAVAALRGGRRRRSVHRLPRAPPREPVAVHVFHPHGRRVGGRLVARDARPRRGLAGRNASDRRAPGRGAATTKRTCGWPRS